jgi:hypothetical protein
MVNNPELSQCFIVQILKVKMIKLVLNSVGSVKTAYSIFSAACRI